MRRGREGPRGQPLGRVGEVDLQELGEEAAVRCKGDGDRRPVIVALALPSERRCGDGDVDLEATGVGKVDQQRGEVSGHGNDPVPDPEVERVERERLQVAEGQPDHVPPAPEQVLDPRDGPLHDDVAHRDLKTDEPVRTAQLRYPPDPDHGRAGRPPDGPAIPEGHERSLPERSRLHAAPQIGAPNARETEPARLLAPEAQSSHLSEQLAIHPPSPAAPGTSPGQSR